MGLAGTPAATQLAGMDLLTKLLAPTTAPLPMETPESKVTLAPIQQFSPTVVYPTLGEKLAVKGLLWALPGSWWLSMRTLGESVLPSPIEI